MTIEHVDPITGMRFCRTYFLSALVANEADYMKGVTFRAPGESSTPEWKPCETGLKKQQQTKTLLFCYLALVKCYTELSNKFMSGKLSVQQLQMQFVEMYTTALDNQGVDVKKAFPTGVAAQISVL